MITKSQAKRKQDIKTKLMAAIAMLLVSSIMMVSSTYAWFTLSTAPEVTGINTAVGANGNLEIALLPKDGPEVLNDIESQVGDSTKAIEEKNVTWGNLVDVSDASYGLDKIQLYPSALNLEENTDNTLGAALLKTPSYGVDGRVSELVANTITAIYGNEGFMPAAGDEVEYGVRAVGNASGMTDRQLAYRNARSAASTAMVQAQSIAARSLSENGKVLANIAMTHALDSTATHTQDDVDALIILTDYLLGTGNQTIGALQQIEKAYINYIVAYAASAANSSMDDTTFSGFANTIGAKSSLKDAMDALSAYSMTLTIPGVSDLIDRIDSVKSAQETLKTLTPEQNGEFTWGQISPALYKLVNVDKLKINGTIPIGDAKENITVIVNSMQTPEGVILNLEPESGVYADIADHCGNYNAKIEIDGLEYQGMTLNVKSTMKTATNQATPYVQAYGNAVTTAGAPAGGNGQDMPISETYGYIIDLAFRTNASASNLLLQTEGIDRIYQNSSGAEITDENGVIQTTMGGGSTMTFESRNAQFTDAKVRELMDAIKIVFFRGTEVLATAKLDMTEAKPSENGAGITAPIKLYTKTAGSTTYEPATGVTAENFATGTYYTQDESDTTKYNPAESYTENTEYYTAVTVPAGETFVAPADAKITALTQNDAVQVSVLVYLDGEDIGNDDVAISGQSAVGTMNLQFSSSAQLDPMDYTPLMEQGDSPEQGGEGQGTNP